MRELVNDLRQIKDDLVFESRRRSDNVISSVIEDTKPIKQVASSDPYLLAGGPPRKLVEHGSEMLFSYDISPDGKRLAYTKGTLTSSLVMISDLK